MRAFNTGWCHPFARVSRLALALLSTVTLLFGTLAVGGRAQQQRSPKTSASCMR
jgi:hypothetical protein